MTRRDWLIEIALGTVPVVGAFLCVMAYQVKADAPKALQPLITSSTAAVQAVAETAKQVNLTLQRVNPTLEKLPGTLSHVNSALDGATAILATVNRLCPGEHDLHPKPCGTLADVARFLDTGRGTLGTLEKAGIHEDKQLATLDGQEKTLFDDLHTNLQGFAKTNSDIDDYITGADFKATQKGLATTAASFGAMTSDAQLKFHALLFPPPCKGWRCRVGDIYEGVKVGSQLIEPAFYLRELITGQAISGSITVTNPKGNTP